MPTTCELIAKTTLTTNPVSVAFDNIPSTYTDLYLVCSIRSTRTGTSWVTPAISFNTATTSGFSGIFLGGNGSSANSASAYDSGYTGLSFGNAPTAGHTANTFSSAEIYIPNYAGSTNKSFSASNVGEDNGTTGLIRVTAGLWSSTAAITKVTIWCNGNVGGHAFSTDSSFYLYGITKA